MPFQRRNSLNTNNEHTKITYIVNQHRNWVTGWKMNTHKAETRSTRGERCTTDRVLNRSLNFCRSTFLMLFLLKWFFIYSDQFLQQNLYVPMAVVTPQDWYFIRWRLLLNGFRSVLVWLQPTNFQTENLICVHQELGSERPSDLYNRFQGELLHYKSLPQPWIWCFRFERFLLYLYSQTCTQCRLYVVNSPVSERFS